MRLTKNKTTELPNRWRGWGVGRQSNSVLKGGLDGILSVLNGVLEELKFDHVQAAPNDVTGWLIFICYRHRCILLLNCYLLGR